MLLKTFAIYDEKAGAYMQPFFAMSTGQATRSFADLASDPTHTIGRHPHDFTLFEIAVWDDQSAMFEMEATHKSLGNGVEHRTQGELFPMEIKANG